MNKFQNIQVGQKLYYENVYFLNGELKEVTVSKVDKYYFTVQEFPFNRFSIEKGEDSKTRDMVWFSVEDRKDSIQKEFILHEIKEKLEDCLSNITLEQVLKIKEILEL